MDTLEKCETKSFENEHSTFCNFQILYHESTLLFIVDQQNKYKTEIINNQSDCTKALEVFQNTVPKIFQFA